MAILAARPPAFVALAGHPVRWGLLKDLSRSDRRVGELVALSGQRQNLVSYHLGKLRAAALITRRRSAADARDAYYSLDLDRCADLVAGSAASLHPGLRLGPGGEPTLDAAATPARVLFLCTGNSSRSQMAEAFLQKLAGAAIEVQSAGSHPKPLHPLTIETMRAHGMDISEHRPKHFSEFDQQPFDYVVTLCDRVREVCPVFPGRGERIHWSIPDPARVEDGAQPEAAAFERAAGEIETRVRYLVHLIAADAAQTSQEAPQP